MWTITFRSSLFYIASSDFSCQALHGISLRALMPITLSMWPLGGTALQSSCWGTSRVLRVFIISQRKSVTTLTERMLTNCNPLQGPLREGSGHVVSGLHLRGTEWWAASVPGREWDRSALHHPESVGTSATRADEALLQQPSLPRAAGKDPILTVPHPADPRFLRCSFPIPLLLSDGSSFLGSVSFWFLCLYLFSALSSFFVGFFFGWGCCTVTDCISVSHRVSCLLYALWRKAVISLLWQAGVTKDPACPFLLPTLPDIIISFQNAPLWIPDGEHPLIKTAY